MSKIIRLNTRIVVQSLLLHEYPWSNFYELEVLSCLAYTEQDAAYQLKSTVLLANQSQLGFTVNNIVSLMERLTDALRFVSTSLCI